MSENKPVGSTRSVCETFLYPVFLFVSRATSKRPICLVTMWPHPPSSWCPYPVARRPTKIFSQRFLAARVRRPTPPRRRLPSLNGRPPATSSASSTRPLRHKSRHHPSRASSTSLRLPLSRPHPHPHPHLRPHPHLLQRRLRPARLPHRDYSLTARTTRTTS